MIPVCTPLLGPKESVYVNDCLKTNWISSSGKYLNKFEDSFSAYCGVKHGIGVTNGTSALHLAVAALKIGPGDEVIMPAFTIASTAFAVMYAGAKPIFVDAEPDTWNIDPDLIETKITKKTKAILVVHIYGHPCEMDQIHSIARRHRLKIIEDAAEAHGAHYRDQTAGHLGHISCFSFYGNKIITTGEGGMVLTDDDKLAERCRSLRNLGFLPEKRFWHHEVAFNYRMTNLQAAIGLAQFEQIEELVNKRRKNAALYNKGLKDIPGLQLPIEKPYVRNVYWMYGLLLKKSFGMSRAELMKRLREKGIDTRTFFFPMNQQPVMKKKGLISADDKFPVSNRIGQEGFYLPSGSGLKKSEIEYICKTVREIGQQS